MADPFFLTAVDGTQIGAVIAAPTGRPRGGLVVVQEIFGLNAHIRAVVDGFAAEGFLTVAPALFDRVRPGVDLGYGAEDIAIGKELKAAMGFDLPLVDIAAALDLAAMMGGTGKAAVVGYCWGGTLAFRSATQLFPAGAVAYYGAQIHEYRTETARCPLLMHFGERDATIPPDHIATIRAAQPESEIHVHPADHGFNCDHRAAFDAASAAAARAQTLDFLTRILG